MCRGRAASTAGRRRDAPAGCRSGAPSRRSQGFGPGTFRGCAPPLLHASQTGGPVDWTGSVRAETDQSGPQTGGRRRSAAALCAQSHDRQPCAAWARRALRWHKSVWSVGRSLLSLRKPPRPAGGGPRRVRLAARALERTFLYAKSALGIAAGLVLQSGLVRRLGRT